MLMRDTQRPGSDYDQHWSQPMPTQHERERAAQAASHLVDAIALHTRDLIKENFEKEFAENRDYGRQIGLEEAAQYHDRRAAELETMASSQPISSAKYAIQAWANEHRASAQQMRSLKTRRPPTMSNEMVTREGESIATILPLGKPA